MSSTLTLSEHPTLPEYQRYLAQAVIERGFEEEDLPQLFQLFLEECGELAKAARKSAGMKSGTHSDKYNPAHEAADVLNYLVLICNKLGIDMEQALKEKEAINKQRVWTH